LDGIDATGDTRVMEGEDAMDYVSVNTSIGLLAAACTTASFVPQLVKIHRQGGRDLSYGMLLLYMLGVVLWFTYGLRIRAAEVILANVVAGVLVSTAIVMKRRSESAP
jgi:MtN3 and saliva related transmembrane protein